jgi:hypothetical protein
MLKFSSYSFLFFDLPMNGRDYTCNLLSCDESTLEPDGNWPIIIDFDQHVRAELAFLGGYSLSIEQLNEEIYQRVGYLGKRSVCEGWASAFACVGVQSELRDHDRSSTHLKQGAIDLSLFVFEDA